MQTDSGSTPNKVLISGNGHWNRAIFLWLIMYVIGAVVVYGSFDLCAELLQVKIDMADDAMKTGFVIVDVEKYNNVKMMASVCNDAAIPAGVMWFLIAPIVVWAIVSTHIQADENGIAGRGGGKYFIWGGIRTFDFRLPYRQITSVDVSGSTIIIHASGAQYKCYVKNPAEIQRVIFEQQQKAES